MHFQNLHHTYQDQGNFVYLNHTGHYSKYWLYFFTDWQEKLKVVPQLEHISLYKKYRFRNIYKKIKNKFVQLTSYASFKFSDNDKNIHLI